MRHFDATLHNEIANHPDIYAFIAGDLMGAKIELDECAARPDSYVLLSNGADAAMVFGWSAPDVWEMHTFFLPSCRGSLALKAATDMIDYMYETIGAKLIWGQTPLTYENVRAFNRKLGGKSAGFRIHHIFGPVELFTCTRDEWNAKPR